MARSFLIMSESSNDRNNTFIKDPQAKLDYNFDFAPRTNQSTTDPDATDYLESGETIFSFEISANAVNSGSVVTISGSSLNSGSTVISYWVQGGDLYKDCLVTARITTSASRIDERSMKIQIKNQ